MTFTERCAPTGDVMNLNKRALDVPTCVGFPQEQLRRTSGSFFCGGWWKGFFSTEHSNGDKPRLFTTRLNKNRRTSKASQFWFLTGFIHMLTNDFQDLSRTLNHISMIKYFVKTRCIHEKMRRCSIFKLTMRIPKHTVYTTWLPGFLWP